MFILIQDISSNVAVVGQVLTHEMGHNFGLADDNTVPNCPCDDPSGNCIMFWSTSLVRHSISYIYF